MKAKTLALGLLSLGIASSVQAAPTPKPDPAILSPSIGFSSFRTSRNDVEGEIKSVNYATGLATKVLGSVDLRLDGTIRTQDYFVHTSGNSKRSDDTVFVGRATAVLGVGDGKTTLTAEYGLTDTDRNARLLEERKTLGHDLRLGTSIDVGANVYVPVYLTARWFGDGSSNRRDFSGTFGVGAKTLFGKSGLDGSASVYHERRGVYGDTLTAFRPQLIYGWKSGAVIDLTGSLGQVLGIEGNIVLPLKSAKKSGDERLALVAKGKILDGPDNYRDAVASLGVNVKF